MHTTAGFRTRESDRSASDQRDQDLSNLYTPSVWLRINPNMNGQ